MRLIDGDALIAQIEKNICEPCRKRKDDYNGVRCRACQYGDEIDDIYDAPTIEERKKGHWIERNPQNSPNCRLIECSECGNAYIVGYNIDYDDWIDGRNFCMKCGADMRGGEDETD